MCDENLLAGMKMFRKMLTFCETSHKILDIYVSAALCMYITLTIMGITQGCNKIGYDFKNELKNL